MAHCTATAAESAAVETTTPSASATFERQRTVATAATAAATTTTTTRIEFAFFDYDGTVTTPVFIAGEVQRWAVSDQPAVCALLSEAQLAQQFGGPPRLALLRAFFQKLRELGISLHIVSHGRETVIRQQLGAVGLLQEGHFATIVASDSAPMRAVRQDKGAYIAGVLRAAGKPPQAAVFMDDSVRNTNGAAGACRVFHVKQQGLAARDMKQIYAACSASVEGATAVAAAAAEAAAPAVLRGGPSASSSSSPSPSSVPTAATAAAAAAAAATTTAPATAAVRHVFLDYDSTVTRPVFLEDVRKWAISDKPDVCARLTPAQLVEQFGGAERLAVLRSFLKRLAALKVLVHVVSHGRERVIRRQLGAVELLSFFSTVVASDSPPLYLLGGDKGRYIASVLAASSLGFHDAVFADDSGRNVETARRVCRVIHVQKPCLQIAGMKAIVAMCGGAERLGRGRDAAGVNADAGGGGTEGGGGGGTVSGPSPQTPA